MQCGLVLPLCCCVSVGVLPRSVEALGRACPTWSCGVLKWPALISQGDYESAIADYGKALKIDPRHFKAVYNRGFSYDKVSSPLMNAIHVHFARPTLRPLQRYSLSVVTLLLLSSHCWHSWECTRRQLLTTPLRWPLIPATRMHTTTVALA